MNIRVEEIRKLERGSLRGFATVNVAGLIRISHIKIIHPEGREAFIQMPQRFVSDEQWRKEIQQRCRPARRSHKRD
jgi:DNA-binding cell septation regulator SpoVG